MAALILVASGCTGGGGGGGEITLVSGSQGEDPVVLEIPVAFIRRPVPQQPSDLRDPLAFSGGAQLVVRKRSAAAAEDIDISAKIAAIAAEEEGVAVDQIVLDIRGLESAYDGKALVFAARAVPEPVSANLDNTTWNLWLLDMQTLQVSYLIPSRIKRNEGVSTGGGQDIAPHFLPDDRIVFSSTRQVASQARLLNEGRGQIFSALDEDGRGPATVLHIYDPQLRGAEFQQISFNRSDDLDPTVLANGDIVFSRWNNTRGSHISLYRVQPSGIGLSPLYGFHSQNSGTGGSPVEFTQVRELDDGRLISVAMPFASTTLGGNIVIVDAQNFADVDQPTWENTGATGPGQVALTDTDIRTDGTRSRGGQFSSVYPLRDGTGRLLLTWSDCRVIDRDNPESGKFLPCSLQPDNTSLAPPLFGAWLYDPAAKTQRPVVVPQEGLMVSEIIAAEPRDFPDLIPLPDNFDSALAADNKGQLLIDSVYDFDGTDLSPAGIAQHARPGTTDFSDRPARFLRIEQPVPIPDRDVFDIPRFAAGVSAAFGFREIAGYVPVEPDGSVTVTVPAQRPFTISVVDVNGRRIGPRHRYWLQVAPGEVLHCVGCHDGNDALPHGRLDTQPPSANPGATALANGNTGFVGTDPALFASAPGQSMAAVWDQHNPVDNSSEAARELSLTPSYTDQWSPPQVTPDPPVQDRAYDPAWTDIDADHPLIVNNLDPGQPGRIVINYIDHIQPIWERQRAPVPGLNVLPVRNCVGCHNSNGDTAVPAGQLDLTAVPSDLDPDHLRSYRELLSADNQQWLDSGKVLGERLRLCTSTDANGTVGTTSATVAVRASMRAGSANDSTFFSCFDGGSCGQADVPPLPDNCTEDGGTIVPVTRNTVDHNGMLSPAELRLLAEWVDIGAQYYNNPFDSRLAN